MALMKSFSGSKMRFICVAAALIACLHVANSASVLMAGVAAVDATLPVGVPLGAFLHCTS